MYQIQNIGNEPKQRLTIEAEDYEVTITLNWNILEEWGMDIIYNDLEIYNIKLSINVLHIRNYNLPFDFTCIDTSDSGIDPCLIDDFKNGRIELYMVLKDEMEQIRGLKVEI